ncbi:MAG TPA: histidine kinase [Bacteroidia bacterium]|jgi:ligand-binding sensor domain-containing protein|nr:histidine kinase [Bacteroidia bacterium]
MLKQLAYLFILVTFFSPPFSAQQPILKNFSTKNGLPSNEVYSLYQDKKGYIWICTDAGLVKYNGNYFKKFSSANGLPDNTVFEVKEDKYGKIWYRSFLGKIGYILNDSVFTISANKKIEEYVKDGIISSFAIDQNDVLYLGKKNSENISFLKISPPYSENNVNEVWKNNSFKNGIDLVCIGENDFVFSDKRGSGKYNNYRFNIYDKYHHLLFADKLEIPEDVLFTRISRNKENIYLIANKLLKKFGLTNKSIIHKTFSDQVISAVPVDSNIILVGERNKGVEFYNNNFNALLFDNLLDGLTFTSAIKDYQNGYWVSSLESGVFYMPSQKINYYTTGNAANERISQLSVNNDSCLFVGSNSGRLLLGTIQRTGKMVLQEIYSDQKNQLGIIGTIFKLDYRTVILSCELGCIGLDLESKKIKKISMKNNPLLIFKKIINYKDCLLCITQRDIYALPKTDYTKPRLIFQSKYRLTSIVYDSINNKIFLGGLRGLYCYNFKEKVVAKDSILNCRVQDLKLAGGKLFIATNAEGLIIKSESGYDTINEKKGLISNICKSITIDKNEIWVSTNSGISKVVYHKKGSFEINNIELSSFTGATSVSQISLLNNKAFFFSGDKLYSFDTKINHEDAKFFISSLKINNKEYGIKPFLILEHNQSNIKVQYEALFYDCNTAIHYRYKMNKDNSVWDYTNETYVNFPYLSPGTYDFIVEAENKEGHWIPADNVITFKIEKPFWQKVWFIIIVALLFGLLITLVLWYFYRRILKQELHKNSLKMLMYDLENKAVKAQMNPHFIFNSLSSIQEFILSDDNENAYRYLSRFSKLIRKLLESNTKESITLEAEIDILKGYIEIEALRFQNAFNYQLNVNEKLNVLEIPIPHMLIQPFVENAIWHGLLHKNSDKNLELTFDLLNENCLICIVEDNGVGRSFKPGNLTENLKKESLAIEFINQRLNLYSKIKKLKYGFEIIDKTDSNGFGTGTIVKIKIPILNK